MEERAEIPLGVTYMADKLPFVELGDVLKHAIKAVERKQFEVADACGVDPGDLSHYIRGDRLPTPSSLVAMVDHINCLASRAGVALRLDLKELLLVRAGFEAAEPEALASFRDILSMYREGRGPLSLSPRGPRTLATFPEAFALRTLLTGDRREWPPQTSADVLAGSASTAGDLFYFHTLPGRCAILTDKVVKLVRRDRLDQLLDHDFIVLGSPLSNLAAQEVNREASFRFAVPADALELARRLEADLAEIRCAPHKLKAYLDRSTPEGAQRGIDRENMLNGFASVDYSDPIGPTHRKNQRLQYGVVSLARHPWSDRHVAVLAAGDRGEATAAALKLLATKGAFAQRPLGGVFKVTVPSGVTWEERYPNLEPEWHTDQYTLDKYFAALDKLDGEAYPAAYKAAMTTLRRVLEATDRTD
jgi:hypothetical protein